MAKAKRLIEVLTEAHRDPAVMMPRSHEVIVSLYEAYGAEARRIAFLITGDREEAEDLTQEAFVRLIGRFGEIRHRDAFPRYLLTTVVNLANSRLRRLRSERKYLRASRHQTSYLPDFGEWESIMRRLQALPYRQKVVVVLRYCEDLSEQQTADVMGISLRAVKSLVARALRALRTEEVRSEIVN